MPYCPTCGTEIAAGAAFCSACGARPDEPARTAPAGAPAPAPEGGRWGVIAGLAGAVALVIVGVVLYFALAGDDGDGDSILGDAGKTPEPGATLTAIAELPSPTEAPPTQPPPTALPTFTPPPLVAGHATPEEAIGAFLADRGLGYAGDCNFIDLDRDVGFYCAALWEDQFDTRTYMAGLAFSEPDTWLLVSRLGAGDDWTVVDFAALDPFGESLEPPWR
jgi:hypothetical protein